MGKKKKKKQKKYVNNDILDFSDIDYNGNFHKVMKQMADSLEYYINTADTDFIFDGISEDEWKKNVAIVEKLIKKLRKGDTSVFDIPTLNEVLSQGHQLVIGLED